MTHTRQRLRRKAMYFTLDGIFGTILIVSAVILFITFSQHNQTNPQPQLTASDAITILNTLTLGELNTTLSNQVIATNLTSENDNVLRAIAVLWATNNSLAPSFTASVLTTFFPTYSYGVYAGSDELYRNATKNQAAASLVATAKQQVSGIAAGRPVAGSTASAFLKKVENKTTSSFIYFGGFVGQGNVTFHLLDLPSDITAAAIRGVTLELDAKEQFTLRINGASCGTFTPTNPETTNADRWTISGCNDKFIPGTNAINIDFNGSIDSAYLAGGFLSVRYVTNKEIPDPYASPKTVFLPSIDGIINLYDSFFVPGTITSMTAYLHYDAGHNASINNNTFYMTIANATVYRDNTSNTTQAITLTDMNLTPFLNYATLGQQTIPFRVGFENLTFFANYTGNANVMVVTDVSGSMNWSMIDNDNGVQRNCSSLLINNSDTQRLSVAKCLDQQFVSDILNVSGNLVGLVNYTTATRAVVALTTNTLLLNTSISYYTPDATTCICCGINSAVAELNRSVKKTTLINAGSSWQYLFMNGSLLEPSPDPSGNNWYDILYTNETQWKSGAAVLGSADNGSAPAITTDMNNTINTVFQAFPNLWPMAIDNDNGTVTFTSGMNSTANLFGNRTYAAGWAWQNSTYAPYTGPANFVVSNGRAIINFSTGTPAGNYCGASKDCSAAYGILVNITPELWTTIQNNGRVRLSFSYWWIPNATNAFTSQDEVWVKARWTNTTGTITNLGTELSSANGDTTPEIARGDNPAVQFSSVYTRDLTPLITGPGAYYLDFGGKIYTRTTTVTRVGSFAFDNVLIGVSNQTDVYYLRKNFTVADLDDVGTGILNLLSDDQATVYINGQLLFDEGLAHSAQYWNVGGYILPQAAFHVGTNEIAIRLENTRGTTKFDFRLEGLNITKSLAMLVMTDGEANVNCPLQGTGNAKQDAVLAACQAKQNWGITVHSVGFSTEADSVSLQSAATCGGGLFASSANTTDLANFYKTVVINILDSSVKSQSVIVTGGYQRSVLYNDSYLRFTFTPAYETLRLNEISIKTQTPTFGTCTPSAFIYPNARILTAQLTSYSGEHWSDIVSVNGITAYNLSRYNSPYIRLGDPFVIDLSPTALVSGTNNFFMQTADSPTNTTGCSLNNSLITTLAIPLSTTYTPVLTSVVGCTWMIEHDDLTTQIVPVPKNYAGAKSCSYTSTNIVYDANDAYDVAVYSLLRSLDHDSDGRIFISLNEDDLEVIVTKISSVPYLWGPSPIEVRVWQ